MSREPGLISMMLQEILSQASARLMVCITLYLWFPFTTGLDSISPCQKIDFSVRHDRSSSHGSWHEDKLIPDFSVPKQPIQHKDSLLKSLKINLRQDLYQALRVQLKIHETRLWPKSRLKTRLRLREVMSSMNSQRPLRLQRDLEGNMLNLWSKLSW